MCLHLLLNSQHETNLKFQQFSFPGDNFLTREMIADCVHSGRKWSWTQARLPHFAQTSGSLHIGLCRVYNWHFTSCSCYIWNCHNVFKSSMMNGFEFKRVSGERYLSVLGRLESNRTRKVLQKSSTSVIRLIRCGCAKIVNTLVILTSLVSTQRYWIFNIISGTTIIIR